MGKRPSSFYAHSKKPTEELGYKVEDASAEEIRKRKEEWEKGKSVPTGAKGTGDVGYKVDTEGVKDRLQKWTNMNSSLKSPTSGDRKDPVKIPTKNATKEEQTDVKTVKYDEQ